MEYLIMVGAVTAFLIVAFIIAINFRTVVSTNDVHIVQSTKKTTSYGRGQTAGNAYYAWPSWLPIWGVKVTKFPVSVFSIELKDYAAYDQGRLPFLIDIMAFFRIGDSNQASERVHSFEELQEQLEGIVQGVSRSILAKSTLEDILEKRNEFGIRFTEAVAEQLKAWGVENVKNMELMDVRDEKGGSVIANIMAKKKSLIEKESRVEVAKNIQAAREAEIDAQRQIELREQEAKEQVGKRTAVKDQEVGIAKQKSEQAVKEQEKATAEKQVEVNRVQVIKTAEIERDKQVVVAEQQRRTLVIAAEGEATAAIARAEGDKKQTILSAEGNLAKAQLSAQGVEAEGRAKGAADTAVNVASVAAQTELAAKIGENKPYQEYLIAIRRVEASQAVGVEQAKALSDAEIKVIANTGNVPEGVTNVMELLSSKGGTDLGSMLEAFGQTDMGQRVLDKVIGGKGKDVSPAGTTKAH
jgi:flotillin